jgi:DHA2 family multidrug resistance protein-like MFS transporter
MAIGCATTLVGLILLTVTSLPVSRYVTLAFVGFTLIGAGLGIYATPSTDVALASVAESRSGAASGIYKMASSLGTALGVAISASIFESFARGDTQSALAWVGRGSGELRLAAAAALWFNVALALLALAAVVFGKHQPRRDSLANARQRRGSFSWVPIRSVAASGHESVNIRMNAWQSWLDFRARRRQAT